MSYIYRPEWTQEEEILLYEIREAGVDYAHIASVIERSKVACSKKYRNTDWEQCDFYDKKTGRVKKERIEKLQGKIDKCIELYRSDKNMQVTFDGDSVKIKQNNPKWWTESQEIILYCAAKGGFHMSDVSALIGRSADACYRKLSGTLWGKKDFIDYKTKVVRPDKYGIYEEVVEQLKEKRTERENGVRQYPCEYQQGWSREDEILLYSMKNEGISYRIIASELNRSIPSCSTKYQQTIWEEKDFFDLDNLNVKAEERVMFKDRVHKLREKRLREEVVKAEIVADKIAMYTPALPIVPLSVYKKNFKSKTKNTPEEVGLILSDAHIGQEILKEETGGLSEYNLDIFKERVDRLKTATAEIVELHSCLYDLPILNIFCLGDMVAGMNDAGAWNQNYINLPIYEQFVEGTDAIAGMINYWLGLFKEIKFFGVYGNHGRMGRRGTEKEYVNWDFLMYQFLMARFKDNPRVHFTVPKTWWIFEKIQNHKFLIVHGDNMRGETWPARALNIYESKMMGILKDVPDYTIAGHYHSTAELSTNHGRVFLNGSFVGGDIYSLKDLQRSSKPEQKIFGIHGKRGVTWAYNLDLSYEKNKKDKKDSR